MNIEKRLQDAIDSGEVLQVTYAGGSQPGAEREIAPISIKNGKVRARCYTSNAVKLFNIEKIKLAEENSPKQNQWTPGKAFNQAYRTLNDVLDRHEQEWNNQGWKSEIDQDCLSLHKIGKRGKLLKTPTVSITYEAETFELVINLNGDIEEQNRRPRVRPWIVRAEKLETKTFKHLDMAIETMCHWASELAPAREGAP